jgi:EpsI family protein
MNEAWRWQVLFFAFALFGAGSWLFARDHVIPPRSDFSRFPALPGWTSTLEPVSNEALRVLKPTDYLSRNYRREADGRLVNVYVGYHGKQLRGGAIHSPRLCLPANGWHIVSLERVPMPGGADGVEINRMVVGRGRDRQLVYYWYQGRGHVSASEYTSFVYRTFDVARRRRSDEALVRFGTTGDDAAADRALEEMVRQVAPLLEPFVPA